jgi:hypothetical protein
MDIHAVIRTKHRPTHHCNDVWLMGLAKKINHCFLATFEN